MKTFKPKIPGFLIGIKIVIVNMLKTLSPFHSKPNVNYPFEKEKVAPRARGVIALDQEACTSCMLCARQCPDWCIYIEGHKELQPPSKPGGRQRSRGDMLHDKERLDDWLQTVPDPEGLES